MSNSVVTLSSFNLLFFTQVLTVLTSTIKYNEYVTDKGGNISIPCIADGNIMWVKENGSNNSTIIQTGKYLVLTNVSASDRGLYVCFAAVTPSRSVHNVNSNTSVNNSTSLNESDIQMEDVEDGNNEQNQNNNNNSSSSSSSSTSSKQQQQQQQVNATRIVKQQPSVDENLVSITKTTQTASTTSMLPMPNSTASATTTTSTPNSTSSSSSSLALASASTTTTTITTTIVIKTLSDSNFTTHSSDNANIYHSSSNSSSSSSSSSITTSDTSLTTFTPISTTTIDDIEEQEFQAFHKINLTVRTPPGPVTKLYFQASTILGFLIWRFNKTNSGGYPVRSFTAEFRNISYKTPPFNSSDEHEWSRMDPINIAPNVRQMEVYRLEPNTTYEFRIWANNQLGSGEVVTTNVTTLPETKEEDRNK